MKFKLLHLYHDIMDLYADKGNIKTFEYRLKKRDIELIYDTCGIGEEKHFSDYDLIFMGGGADLEQRLLAKDLILKKNNIKDAMENKVNFLLICGGYQLFGEYYEDAKGNKIQGLNLLPYHTKKPDKKTRCTGNVIVQSILDDEPYDVVGFENHSGQTILYDEKNSFGKVLCGNGNSFGSTTEGYMDDQVIATYIHGPLLPKNPRLADFIIKRSLVKNYGKICLPPLDDTLENMARDEVMKKIV